MLSKLQTHCRFTNTLELFLLRFTVLFSHGNAVDLGQMSSFYIGLGTRINCNIFSYDYSGYGVSTGKPTEKNLYADIDAAWHALRTRYTERKFSQMLSSRFISLSCSDFNALQTIKNYNVVKKYSLINGWSNKLKNKDFDDKDD